jgi:malonate decarboxylase beta subunit
VATVQGVIQHALDSLEDAPTDLSFRYTNPIAVKSGRVATNKVRQMMAEQWPD